MNLDLSDNNIGCDGVQYLANVLQINMVGEVFK